MLDMNILGHFATIAPMSWVVWSFILIGPRDILKAGRSKNGYRKLMKSMSFKDKFFMRNFIELSKTAKKLQRFFIVWTYFFYGSVVIFILLIIMYIVFPSFSNSIRIFLGIKVVFIELPGVYVVVKNRYQKKGRIGWKFMRDYKKQT